MQMNVGTLVNMLLPLIVYMCAVNPVEIHVNVCISYAAGVACVYVCCKSC